MVVVFTIALIPVSCDTHSKVSRLVKGTTHA